MASGIKVNDRCIYLYRPVDSRGCTVDFYLSPRLKSKSEYRFMGKILKTARRGKIPREINTDKAHTYARALALLKREEKCQPDVEHLQIKRSVAKIWR